MKYLYDDNYVWYCLIVVCNVVGWMLGNGCLFDGSWDKRWEYVVNNNIFFISGWYRLSFFFKSIIRKCI